MNGKLLKDDKKPPVMHLVIKHSGKAKQEGRKWILALSTAYLSSVSSV